MRAQVGAAFAVLQEGAAGAARPFALQAAKSRVLHTEPAAGAVGLAAMAAQLSQMPSPAMLHLRHVNPHVAAIFQVCWIDGHSPSAYSAMFLPAA